MALKDPRRIPEEKAATHEELTAAIEGLTRSDLVKLYKSAAYRVKGLGRSANGRDFEVLLQETILAFFKPDGRKWKKGEVDIVRTLTEAMRSVANNWKRAFDDNEALLESELITSNSGSKSNPYAEYADSKADIQSDLEMKGHYAEVAAQVAQIEKIVQSRETAALIVMGVKDGLTGPELKRELEISQNDLETEMVWIRRNVRAAFKEGEKI